MKYCTVCKRPVPKQDAGDDTPHCPECDRVLCAYHIDRHACTVIWGEYTVDPDTPILAK